MLLTFLIAFSFFFPVESVNDYVCDETVNRCYHLTEQLVNFTEAKQYCSSLGETTRLVEIRSELETEALLPLYPLVSWVWIGITDQAEEGHFVYATSGDELADYVNWDDERGEPDGGTVENCVIARVNYEWAWLDYRCGMKQFALCEMIMED